MIADYDDYTKRVTTLSGQMQRL